VLRISQLVLVVQGQLHLLDVLVYLAMHTGQDSLELFEATQYFQQ